MKRLFARLHSHPAVNLVAPALQEVADALRPAAVQLLWFVQPMYGLYRPVADINALVELLEQTPADPHDQRQ